MLEQLSKRDNEWRKMAIFICKDKLIADEITQEMYLRVYKYAKRVPDNFYIYATLKNCFLDYVKENKKTSRISDIQIDLLVAEENTYNKDYDRLLEALNKEFEDLYWYDRNIVTKKKGKTEHYKNGKIKKVTNGKPYRSLEAESNISTISLFNTVKKVKGVLKIKLQKEYQLWQKNQKQA